MRLCLALLLAALPLPAADVDFNRDVRPILSDRCFKCHGPSVQKGQVRLDSLAHAEKKDAVVPGKPAESGVIDRVTATGDKRMPPPDSGPPLTAAQVKTLTAWVEAGAKYEPHWAFVPPARPDVPKGAPHPVDAFAFARLATAGVKPSPEAEKSVLLRRVYLDLIGLLPTPAEAEAFLKDDSPDAYETVVDRLLKSEHYGERQARHWLDLARYADSNGYTVDGARSIWPYRDWVIKAFNADLPFDRFTVEQLAGDLLPNPTPAQLVATGFHRNTAFNEEGGADAEQFRVERTVDRTNTTAAVWLGLTLGCAQCHDHKYDPLPQADYYRLYAFFNSVDEPSITVGGTPELEARVNELTAKATELKAAGKLDEGKAVEAEMKKVQGKVPTTLVLRERKTPRGTFVQVRGDFLRKGAKVEPAFPAALGPVPKGVLTRLELAKWLVGDSNPLTARVVVNRAWQQFFGRGLVDTENDFGMQGSPPTHPELLDWLAVELANPDRKGGGAGAKAWSLKALHRLIVTSATYKQSSVLRADLKDDPQNKLLARQTRLRLEAEIIRDAALSASGLLCEKVGGPGVYPPLPKEVFAFTQSNHPWPESTGDDRHRRGMYTFLWRQSQHHLLTTFDAADAQVSCTRRARSNTPLQALHLANDPAFVEFFAGFGKRVVTDGPKGDAERVAFAFRLCFARTPNEKEAERVLAYLAKQEGTDAKRWAAVGRVLMNLDEFVTRE